MTGGVRDVTTPGLCIGNTAPAARYVDSCVGGRVPVTLLTPFVRRLAAKKR